jgi:ABC-2 type transport system permease protein
MKKILNLAWNDIKIEFSDRSALLFFFILPLIFTAILGSSFGGSGDPNTDNRWLVPVVDLDQSKLSKEMIAELEQSDVIRPATQTDQKAKQMLSDGDVAAILIIRQGFETELLSGTPVELDLVKSPNDPNVLAIEQAIYTVTGKVSNRVMAAVQAVAAAERSRPFESEAERQAYFNDSLAMAQEVMAEPVARSEITTAPAVPRSSFTAFELSSAGQLVTWTLITLLGASEVFVNERIGGTLRRLLSTPSRKVTVLSGKITGRFSMGLLQMAVLIIAGALLFKVNWGSSPLALGMVVVSFGLSAVALGVMLGAFAKTRSQASNLTVMFSMIMAALGGAWWQLEVTPPLYQKIVQFLPSTWAMKGFNEVIVKGGGPMDVLPISMVLLSFAVLFFIIGVRRLRFE